MRIIIASVFLFWLSLTPVNSTVLVAVMKVFFPLLVAFSISTNGFADTAAVTFDGGSLQGSFSYIEDGYRFDGALSADSNFPASGTALRIYGNVPLTISRVDGDRFSLEAFSLLYRSDSNAAWLISNEQGQGFALSRGGLYSPSELGSTMTNILSARIFDPSWNGTSYQVLDSFQLSHVSTVPEPDAGLLFLLGLGTIFARRFRART